MKIKAQEDLNNLSSWLATNSLKLNVQKTKVMLLNREGLFPNVDLKINNQLIESVQTFKFLGVTLDHHLSFQTHHAELHSKLLCSTYVLRSLGRLLPRDPLRMLYFAYYHSHLTYCMPIWYPLLPNALQKTLTVLQKRIIRTLSKADMRQHCMPLYRDLRILTVHDSLYVENIVLCYRLFNQDCPQPICNLYDNQETRISIPKHSSTKVNKSFLCKPLTEWHQLPVIEQKLYKERTTSKKTKTKIDQKVLILKWLFIYILSELCQYC